MIERWTTAFVDDVIEDGTCDLASVIGVPAVVTVDWLGLDVDDWRRYSRALHSVLAHRVGSPEHAHAVEVDIPWMERTITEAIAERRREPRDDVISVLLEAEVDGQPITDDAVYSIVELLISGGVGTTASLVSQTLVHLVRAPRPAGPAGRAPGAARPRRRGVPPRLLADPGTGPDRHPGRRLPRLPHEGGRPGPARVVVRQPRPRPSSTAPTRSTSTAGRTGTRRSAWASTGAPARTSAGPSPAS